MGGEGEYLHWNGRLDVKQFFTNRRLSFVPYLLVAAPAGMTLGGGAKVVLHAAARQPHFELHMGLGETGVSLMPASGGLKEMLLRALDAADRVRHESRADSVAIDAFARDDTQKGSVRHGDRVCRRWDGSCRNF